MRYPLRSKQSGFTLLELMITLVVLAVLAGIAMPSFFDLIRDTRLDSRVSALQSALRYARSEALQRNGKVYLAATDNNFANGWKVQLGADDSVLRTGQEGLSGLTCTGCAGPVEFTARGTLDFDGTAHAMSISDDRGESICLRVALSGRISQTDGACIQGEEENAGT